MRRGTSLLAVALLALSLPCLAEAPASRQPRAGAALAGRFDASVAGGAALSDDPDRSLLAAPALSFGLGSELLWGAWVPLRLEWRLYSVSPSAMDEYLFSYRGFWGHRFSAETGARLRPGRLELEILAGAAVSASKYADTSLVSAYLSALGELRALYPLRVQSMPGLKLTAGLPFECMLRGSTRTYSLGLSLGVSLPLWKEGTR